MVIFFIGENSHTSENIDWEIRTAIKLQKPIYTVKLNEAFKLNSALQMKIISYIEKQLPASLYDAEWAALSDKLNKRKYVSFTNSEKRVPVLFVVVYICVSLCGIAFLF